MAIALFLSALTTLAHLTGADAAVAARSDDGLFDRNRYEELGAQAWNTTVPSSDPPPFNGTADAQAGCFPSIGFTPPAVASVYNTPAGYSLNTWKCDQETERGFFGFSYYVEGCQSYSELLSDFTRMRTQFNARYVRLYSWCDTRNDNFPADVVLAAYRAGLGVYFTIWFGFDGTSDWVWRRDTLIWLVQNVPLARYVIRSIDVGSEPLYDWVLNPQQLADQVWYLKSVVNQYGIQVSVSEMKWGFEVQGDAQVVLNAVDVVHAHNLPFFDQDASYGSSAWPSVRSSTEWFRDRTGSGKKVVFTQTGWPTNTDVWPPNNPAAVASVASSKAYLDLLDSHCADFKYLHGGVGWFWQIYKDDMLPGWGALGYNGQPKFTFAPRVDC